MRPTRARCARIALIGHGHGAGCGMTHVSCMSSQTWERPSRFDAVARAPSRCSVLAPCPVRSPGLSHWEPPFAVWNIASLNDPRTARSRFPGPPHHFESHPGFRASLSTKHGRKRRRGTRNFLTSSRHSVRLWGGPLLSSVACVLERKNRGGIRWMTSCSWPQGYEV
jgi:hypothetical protein